MPDYIHPVLPVQINANFYHWRGVSPNMWMHCGTDYQAYYQSDWAMRSGKVIQAGWESSMGYYIIIDCGGGCYIRYMHHSKLLVSVGQYVSQGQIIGVTGNTGNSTGPHLHIDISFRTMTDARAELARFGAVSNASMPYWRINQAFIDSTVVVNKEPINAPPPQPIQENRDMRVFYTLDTKAYYVTGAEGKRWINDMPEVNMMLRSAGQTVAENCYQAEIDTIPTIGEPTAVAVKPVIDASIKANTSEGIVQEIGKPSVYHVALGMKRHVKNANLFNAQGFDWNNIGQLSAGDLALIPDFEEVIRTVVREELDKP